MENNEKKVATIFDYAKMCDTLPCYECPLSYDNNDYNIPCYTFVKQHIEETNDIILTWLEKEEKKNRVKTYADDFFERCPDAPRKDETQIPQTCLKYIYGLRRGVTCSGHFCEDCWNLPYKEDEDDNYYRTRKNTL